MLGLQTLRAPFKSSGLVWSLDFSQCHCAGPEAEQIGDILHAALECPEENDMVKVGAARILDCD